MTDVTTCPVCEGEHAICDETGMFWEPCFNCCCVICGEPTSTPPLCERHQREVDDERAAVMWRQGRYE